MEAQNNAHFTPTGEQNSPTSQISHDSSGYWKLFQRTWKMYCASIDTEKAYKEQAKAYQAEIKEMREVIINLVDELLALKQQKSGPSQTG